MGLPAWAMSRVLKALRLQFRVSMDGSDQGNKQDGRMEAMLQVVGTETKLLSLLLRHQQHLWSTDNCDLTEKNTLGLGVRPSFWTGFL